MIMTDEKCLYLRSAVLADAMLLFQWRNEKATRANSLHSEELVYEDHVHWLERVLEIDKARYFYILMKGNMPIGQIRLCEDNEMMLISYSVDVSHRGRGYGRTILQMLEEKLSEQNTPFILVGYVKQENIASQRAFISLGYCEGRENNLFRYEKRIG